MKITGKANIIEMTELCAGIYSMWIEAPALVEQAIAGQFVALYCEDASRMLPRPISICELDQKKGWLRLVFRVAGAGTEEFSRLTVGDKIELMGPLGNGFSLEDGEPLLIGGGIGIPPMLELAKALYQKRGKKGKAVLGYRDNTTFLAEEFAPYAEVFLASDDGSVGTKGTVLDAIWKQGLLADILYACGPTPMLRGIQAYAAKQKLPAQISLEERMACGIGACLACVCQSTQTDAHTHVKNKRICKDGPVFYAEEVEL